MGADLFALAGETKRTTPMLPDNPFAYITKRVDGDLGRCGRHATDMCDRTGVRLLEYRSPFVLQLRSLAQHEHRAQNPRELASVGCMMGMVAGDALGAPVEFSPVDYSGVLHVIGMKSSLSPKAVNAFRLKPGQFTDDASMGLCLADSLLECRFTFDPRDVMLRFAAWWYGGYNNAFRLDRARAVRTSVGLGGIISQSLEEFLRTGRAYTTTGDSNSSGNGSIMRNAAVPVCFWADTNRALQVASEQSRLTHRGIEAVECAQLLTFLCARAIQTGVSSTCNVRALVRNYAHMVEATCTVSFRLLLDSGGAWNWQSANYRYDSQRAMANPGYVGAYAMDCIAMALHCVDATDSFAGALLYAVNHCGDSDSVGSVTGQIAGALYGVDAIPSAWRRSVGQWDDAIEVRALALHRHRMCA